MRIRGGALQIRGGPFAETKEQLEGFYLLEGDDRDHAIRLVVEIPAAENGSIELRPI